MIIMTSVTIICVVLGAVVFFRSRRKAAPTIMPSNISEQLNSYPADDPYVTDPTYSAFGGNCAHFIFWDRPNN